MSFEVEIYQKRFIDDAPVKIQAFPVQAFHGFTLRIPEQEIQFTGDGPAWCEVPGLHALKAKIRDGLEVELLFRMVFREKADGS